MKNYSHKKTIAYLALAAIFVLAGGYGVYTTFIIPEFVFITVTKNLDNGIHVASDPPDLYKNPKAVSRFSSIMLSFRNETGSSCVVKVESDRRQRQYVIKPGEPGGVVFADAGKVNTINFCDAIVEIDLRR